MPVKMESVKGRHIRKLRFHTTEGREKPDPFWMGENSLGQVENWEAHQQKTGGPSKPAVDLQEDSADKAKVRATEPK